MTAGPSRTLVIELLGGLGDVLLALPAIHALSLARPEVPLDVLTFAPGDTLLHHDPHVDTVLVTADHSAGAPRSAVEKALHRRDYDLVVTTTTYDGIADVVATRAPRSVTNLWQSPPDGELVDRRFLSLLHSAGEIPTSLTDTSLVVHLSPDERRRGRELLAAVVPVAAVPAVLVPRSGMAVKEWGDARWSSLASSLVQQGFCAVVVAGSAESGLTGIPMLPTGDLRTLAAMLAAVGERGGVVVGGDTGPVRLASAVGTPAVGLFGPTSAGRYGLSSPHSRNLQGWPECPVRLPTAITEQECWWSARCPFGAEPQCMAAIEVAEVVRAVLELRVPVQS